MQTWALIADSFRDAIDRKLFWVMLAITLVIAVAMFCIGFDEKGISVLFGTWHVETAQFAMGSDVARARVGALTVHYLGDFFVGWIGIVAALIATAGALPALMEKGAIDVVLSKPISRAKVFLAKYAGSMVFVLVQAAAFVVLTFLIMGFRWGYWLWGWLWAIPLFVLLFSYLYCFCALFAVTTGSAMTSLLLTLAAWVVIWIPQVTCEMFLTSRGLNGFDDWRRMIAAVRWIAPKTRDIPMLAAKLAGASTPGEMFLDIEDAGMPPENRDRLRYSVEAQVAMQRDVSVLKSVGSSLVFEAVVVLIALWKFHRKDF